MKNSRTIKLGILGGRRGNHLAQVIKPRSDLYEVSAFCDTDESVLLKCREDFPSAKCYTRYEDLLEQDIDAVVIATPMKLHAAQTIQALRAGKHVLAEVLAAITLDECWALVEEVERSGLVYMMAENYCYHRANQVVLNIVRKGLLGKLTYGEGGYLHDWRNIMFRPDGSWIGYGELKHLYNGNVYPTHSFGPLAQWFGLLREGGDSLVSLVSFATGQNTVAPYVREHFGADHPGAQNDYWKMGDTSITVMQTANEALLLLRHDTNSPRPHNVSHYGLQGTKGAYLAGRTYQEDPLIWIEGMSEGESPGNSAKWDSLWKFTPEYDAPFWRSIPKEEHHWWTGDGMMMQDFADAVHEGTLPPINVYDAVTWSAIMPLSIQSIREKGKVLEFPDFTRGKRLTLSL